MIPNRTAQAGQALYLTAADVAREMGLTLPAGQVWEVDMTGSTVPPGVTIEWDRVHGVIDPAASGDFTLLIFWADTTGHHGTTRYVVRVANPALAPVAAKVAAYLGKGDDPRTVALAEQSLPIVLAFTRAYTRGNGFDAFGVPSSDLAAVVITATARLVTNPEQSERVTVGDYSESFATFAGWTLPELAVLHLYRRRTA